MECFDAAFSPFPPWSPPSWSAPPGPPPPPSGGRPTAGARGRAADTRSTTVWADHPNTGGIKAYPNSTTWQVYRGSNGANQVHSFVRTGNTSSGTVDVRAICQWIRDRGWFGDVTIGDVQFDYEITSSAGGKDFVTNSFTVSG
jgi:hypothetical protein